MERLNTDGCFVNPVEVSGWTGALIGMRNPKNSWDLSDTKFSDVCNEPPTIGEKDMRLAQNLIKGGTEHRKFLRMIHVQLNVCLPRFLLQELDTYKVGTVTNSCSTMHKLLDKVNTRKFTLDDFVYYEEDKEELLKTIDKLNSLREEFTAAKEEKNTELCNHLLKRAKTILPESYCLPRIMDMNYETLRTIYHQRKNHRLNELWNEIFCEAVRNLPYAKEFITDGE